MQRQLLFQFALIIVSVLIFLKGYLPVRQIDTEIIDPPGSMKDFKFNMFEMYEPKIDRLVFIIIDALREDFIGSQTMPYLHAHSNCNLKVKVESPTVTLPRIKALTTGGVPQFADIIFNLGATTKLDDSFLHRAKSVGKKMIFYGDNTWIKLFPDMFVREEGVTSFFVNDFTEVDTNVTRNIDDELNNIDWDMMFLHYLGLDHIGHVRGPYSALVKPKLQEMDDVIEQIHKASKLWNKRTLILVTGDHGMRDAGGHGGTTYSETHVPLVAFGSNISCKRYNLIAQTDIPTTIAALFGIQIPANSVGKLIPEFFSAHSLQQLLYAMHYNLLILRKSSDKCNASFKEAVELHYKFLHDKTDFENIFKLYNKCLHEMTSDLIQSSVEQNVYLLIFSLFLTMNCLISIFQLNTAFQLISVSQCILLFIFPNYSLLFITVLAVNMIYMFFKKLPKTNFNLNKQYLVPLCLHAVLLQSSSFIEEEHQILYFYLSTVSILLASNAKSIKEASLFLAVVVSLRFLRRLNTVGDQWASYPDLRVWFLLENNYVYLQIFHAVALVLVYLCLINIFNINSKLLIIILASIYCFKIYTFNLGLFIWILIAVTLTIYRNFIVTWILIIALLVKPYNTILIPACILCSSIFSKYIKNISMITVLHIWLGYTLFFCQGHCNTLASIDLTPGYIGLTSYVSELVFLFTIFHTYAFPILSLLLIANKYNSKLNNIVAINIIYRLVLVLFVHLITFIQRGHLFVWSVFAPKLLIESIHIVVLFLIFLVYAVSCKCHYVIKQILK